MIIRIQIENMFSFKDPVEISMIASLERIHPHHVLPANKKNDVRLVRFATFYGANASGKSNLIKVMKFVKDMVVTGMRPDKKIPVQRFRLDRDCLHKPAQFKIEFKTHDQIYEYGFLLDSVRIHREWLFKLSRRSPDMLLFERETNSEGITKVEFGSFVKKLNEEDQQFLSFVGKGTRQNQLYLCECHERNVENFSEAYNWFDDVLMIIEPNSVNFPTELGVDEDTTLQDFLAELLSVADTGIISIESEDVEFEKQDISEDIRTKIIADLSEDNRTVISIKNSQGVRLVIIKNENGEIRTLKLTTRHKNLNTGYEAKFEVSEESDGTQRLIDLAPMLYLLIFDDDENVFLVDEMARSLHAKLARLIVEIHLDKDNTAPPSQLIITTHETNMLNLDFLRRDEIWFIEKDHTTGSSHFYSLHDFQPRYDKDVLKDYLYGRYGAIPYIGNPRTLRLKSVSNQDMEETK